VSLDVAPGRITVLLGPNGAGKTTLFALIARLFSPLAGRIEIAGRDLSAAGHAALAPLGIVFQQPTLDLDLTVRQNMAYFAALRGLGRGAAEARIGQELAQVDILDRLDDPVRELSGGQRRRVEIARAFLHGPSVLLLDEPTVGLDIPTRQALVEGLHARAAKGDIAILWATHLIDEIRDGDRVVVLNQGKVVAEGEIADVLARAGASSLGEAFSRLTAAAPS
jgi:ABC-2 type transport system ATP-binding protein